MKNNTEIVKCHLYTARINNKVIPWNQWAGGYVNGTVDPPLIDGGSSGPGLYPGGAAWQMSGDYLEDDYSSPPKRVIDHLPDLGGSPTVVWDAGSLADWTSDSSGRYGFHQLSPLLVERVSGQPVSIVVGCKANLLADGGQPWRAKWVTNALVQDQGIDVDKPRAFHVQRMMENYKTATGLSPTIFNLELEGLISEVTNWWGNSSWPTRDADLAEFTLRVRSFLNELRTRNDDSSWKPQPTINEVWLWPTYWSSRNGPAIIKALFDAVTQAGCTPRFYNYVPLAPKYANFQENWFAERELRAFLPANSIIPCLWLWNRERTTPDSGSDTRFWTWQIEAAFETALAWYPSTDKIVIDVPGSTFGRSVVAVARFLNRMRAI